MALFINETGLIGQFFAQSAANVSGDLYLIIILVMIALMVLLIAMGVPLEWTAVIVLPLMITGAAFSGEFITMTGIIMLYLGVLFAKVYFTNR